MGPAVVVLVVLGWWASLERMAVMVMIAVRSGLSCRQGRLLLALRGLPLSETKNLFFFSSIVFLFLVYMYMLSIVVNRFLVLWLSL